MQRKSRDVLLICFGRINSLFWCVLRWMDGRKCWERPTLSGLLCLESNCSTSYPAKGAAIRLYIFFKLSKLGPLGSINPVWRPKAESLFFPLFPSGQWIYHGGNNCQAKCPVKWRTGASAGGVFITVLTLWLLCRELFCHKLEQCCGSIPGKLLSARLPASVAFPTAT